MLESEFKTHFKRPNKFHFRWTYLDPSARSKECGVWTDGTTFNESYFGKTTQVAGFSQMMWGATGVSSNAVNTISNILFSEPLKMHKEWHNIINIHSLPETVVHGVECLHLVGTNKHTDDIAVWVEKTKFLIRRLERRTVMTEEDCSRMIDELDTELVRDEMKNAGLSSEAIESTLSDLANSFKPCSYSHIYNYKMVNINQPIADSLFTAL